MNKRYLVLIIVILLITAGVFSWLFWKNSERKNRAESVQEKAASLLSEIKCDFKNNGEAQSAAIDKKNTGYCSCIKDEIRKTKCVEGVMNASYYEQAVAQYDRTICGNITEEILSRACLSMVGKGVESLKNNNPAQLAFLYNQSGNYDGAIALLKDSGEISNMLALAVAYSNKGLQVHKESEYLPKAFELIERCKKIDPSLPEIYKVEGFAYEVKADIDKAVESYDKAISLDSGYIPAYVGKGHALHMYGAFFEAEEVLEKAKSLDKDQQYLDIYSNLCLLQSTNSDLLEKAAENCNIVINAKTNSPSSKSGALNVLSNVYMKMGKFNEAKASLEKALTLGFNKTATFVGFANLYNKQGEYSLAQKNAEMAIEEDSFKSMAYNSLSYALYKQGKTEEAIRMAEKGLKMIEKDPSVFAPNRAASRKDLYYILANIYNYLGDNKNETKYKGMGDSALKD